MPIFERTTKKLVKEIGDKKLRPVKCLERATKIRRFSLIRRKKARSLFWQLPDDPLDVSLMHILEPGSSVPEVAEKVPALFSDTVVRKQQVAGNVNAGAEADFSEETTVSRESSLEYQIVSTPHETWTELQKRKLLDPEPDFLKQCREAGVNLYVVTDTVELLNSTVLQEFSSMNTMGKVSILLNIWAKGEGQGGGSKEEKKKVSVPKGSVLAYRRKQLVFNNKSWGICHIADDDKEKTFPGDDMGPAGYPMGLMHEYLFPAPPMDDDEGEKLSKGGRGPAGYPMGPMRPPAPPMGICHIADDDKEKTFPGDFKQLQEEVSQKVKAAELSKDMHGIVFSNLLEMLGDREALEDLMDKLELEPFGHLDGPGGTILTELRKDPCYPEVGSKFLLLYLLEALMVLSDIQLDLLAQSLEKRILLPQRDLVRSILEPNFNCPQNTPFTLRPELLAPLQGEGLDITYGLLYECGLQMEPNSPGSTWDPEALGPLSALYGTLSVLRQLAEA